MYRTSQELASIVIRWNEAIRAKQGKAIANMLSASDELRYIGTAENEFWGGALLREGIVAHFNEVPDFEYRDGKVEAYEAGDMGWALWTGFIYFPTTDVLSDYRISFVFGLEDGLWKIVQIHISNPTPNFEKLGIEHQALDALVNAARDGSLGLGHADTATIMFTDVVDSSGLADMLGDRGWATRIDGHLNTVTRIVEKSGGTLVKSLGDGTMSTFTSTRAALTAAQDIMRQTLDDTTAPALRLRVGLHTGEVIKNKGDFFGTVVNKAARINAAAAPDEIRLSDATHIILGRTDEFAIDDPKNVELKGLEGRHRVYRLSV